MEKKLLYNEDDVTVIFVIEQEILKLLDEEYYNEPIKTFCLASICMGLYETYKQMKDKNSKEDLFVFIEQNKKYIKQEIFNLLKRFKEQEELEEQNILYN